MSPGLAVSEGCCTQSPKLRLQPGTSNKTGGTKDMVFATIGGSGPGSTVSFYS